MRRAGTTCVWQYPQEEKDVKKLRLIYYQDAHLPKSKKRPSQAAQFWSFPTDHATGAAWRYLVYR